MRCLMVVLFLLGSVLAQSQLMSKGNVVEKIIAQAKRKDVLARIDALLHKKESAIFKRAF